MYSVISLFCQYFSAQINTINAAMSYKTQHW